MNANVNVTKSFFKGFITIIVWMFLVVFSLSSCSSRSAEKKEELEITTEIVDLKVVDILEAIGKNGRGSVSVAYILLENDDIIVYTYNKYVYLPYTKEEARQIMAFRRGEDVTLKVEVPVEK